MAEQEAVCACGQLAVRCAGEPELVSLCHCRACQKRTGSPYGVAAFFLKRNATITGSSQKFKRSSDSSHHVEFHFCPKCGSSVFWYPLRKSDMIAVAAGSFADPNFYKPSQEVYLENRFHWVTPLKI